jgi:A118 family predicted phage portal protein
MAEKGGSMMPLPTDSKTHWPPPSWKQVFDLYAEHDAWYSGDPNRLANVYSSMVQTPTPRGKHWAKEVKDERRTMLHVPIAGDIAGTSADLLFSEAPKIRIPEAHDGKSNDAKKTQERLDIIINEGGIFNRFVEGAETSAALGGVFIKPNWDSELAPFPILSLAQADNAVPEFKWGFLQAVTFWKVLETDGRTVWRLLERHEKGVILNGLYKGTDEALGVQVRLDSREDTADIEEVIQTGINDVLVRYVPNMRPNRRFRGSSLGQSDYAGSEGLMDALDEVYSSWMRDIRLGQGRIMVPEYFLERREGDFAFDVDKEVFTTFDMPLGNEGMSQQININQFAIRTEEHKKASLELLDRIISSAGYSPQSFGLQIEGRAESGTALNIRERRSFITKSKKERYWKPAIEDVLFMMLQIDNLKLGSRVPLFRPSIEFQDSIQNDINQVATSVEMLNRAQAISTETKVRMIHPDWEKEQVEAEVKRILDEQGMGMPDPIQVGVS